MKPKRPFILGIAGGSGCGKTYLARTIAQSVGREQVQVLSMYQYFRSNHGAERAPDINFDHPGHLDFELMVDHIKALRKGKSVTAPLYDFREMSRQKSAMVVEPTPILIVEGLFVRAKPMVELFDVTCFLDVDDDQRLLGRIMRDVPERGSTIEEIVDRYQRFVRPSYQVFVAPTKQNADIVVDFTYRRILFTKLLGLLLAECMRQGFDLKAFVKEMRAECHHLGFTPAGGGMPVSVNILKLAKDYPESESVLPKLKFVSAHIGQQSTQQ